MTAMKNKNNKRIPFVFILTILLLSCLPTWGQNLGTDIQKLVDWQFSLDSIHWQQVAIPHSYNATDGHSRKYYRGKAYYRRNVVLSESDLRRPLMLLFGEPLSRPPSRSMVLKYKTTKVATLHFGSISKDWFAKVKIV